jgi:putative flippase GtrA
MTRNVSEHADHGPSRPAPLAKCGHDPRSHSALSAGPGPREGARAWASRPVLFTMVGVIGYGVQTVALWLLIGQAGAPIVVATLLATELAVLHNVAWHIRVTWADRPVGPMATLARVLRFNVANGGVSLAGGAILMPLLVNDGGLHYLVANVLTVLVCSAVNYVAGDRWVFVRQRPGEAT